MAMLKHEAEEDGISDATTLRLASSPDMDDSFAELSPHGTEEPPMHLHGTEGYPPRNPRCGVPMVGCTCHHGAACRARGEDDASISQKSVASSHVLAFDGEEGRSRNTSGSESRMNAKISWKNISMSRGKSSISTSAPASTTGSSTKEKRRRQRRRRKR